MSTYNNPPQSIREVAARWIHHPDRWSVPASLAIMIRAWIILGWTMNPMDAPDLAGLNRTDDGSI